MLKDGKRNQKTSLQDPAGMGGSTPEALAQAPSVPKIKNPPKNYRVQPEQLWAGGMGDTGAGQFAMPETNIEPWQTVLLTKRAERSKKIGERDLVNAARNGVTPPEVIAGSAIQQKLLQGPDMSRVDAASQKLDEAMQNPIGIAPRAQLERPNDLQIGAAGLAGLFQPNKAFDYLSAPLANQLIEQNVQQQRLDNQNVIDRQSYQAKVAQFAKNLMDEYDASTSGYETLGKAYGDELDLEGVQYAQDSQTLRNRESIAGRQDVANLNAQIKVLTTQMVQDGRMTIEQFRDDVQRSKRVYEFAIESGKSQDEALQWALASLQQDFYENQNIQQRTETGRVEARLKEAQILKTQADVDYIKSRTNYTNAITSYLGEEMALDWAKHDLNVWKYENGESTDSNGARTSAAKMIEITQKLIAGKQERLKEVENILAKGTPEQKDSALQEKMALIAEINQFQSEVMKNYEFLQGSQTPPFDSASGGGAVTRILNETMDGVTGNSWRAPVANYRITSNFGPRSRPTAGASSNHAGIDLAVPQGSMVWAARPGKVIFAGTKGGYGYTVMVDHGDGHVSLYGHLSEIGVKVGDVVEGGQSIALSGGQRGTPGAGTSTGAHLHFEVRKNGRAIDPKPFLK